MGEPADVRRRGAPVVETVLTETIALLAERGYGFSVDDVAARAGVHKTTVYRRWKTKPVLVAAAIEHLAAGEVVAPETDDALADLEALAVMVAESIRRPSSLAAMRALLSAAAEDADLLPVAREFFEDRYTIAIGVIERAQAQGRLAEGLDARLTWEAIANPLHIRAILGVPADDDTARRLVALVVAGAAPGAVSVSRRRDA